MRALIVFVNIKWKEFIASLYISVVNTTQKIPVQYKNRVFDYFYSAIIKLGEFYVQQLTDHDIYKNNSHLRVLI